MVSPDSIIFLYTPFNGTKSNESRNLVLYPHRWANQLSLSHSSPHNKAKLHNMLKIVMQHVHFINIMLKFALNIKLSHWQNQLWQACTCHSVCRHN